MKELCLLGYLVFLGDGLNLGCLSKSKKQNNLSLVEYFAVTIPVGQ